MLLTTEDLDATEHAWAWRSASSAHQGVCERTHSTQGISTAVIGDSRQQTSFAATATAAATISAAHSNAAVVQRSRLACPSYGSADALGSCD